MTPLVLVCALLWGAPQTPAAAPAPETIVDIRVHGNHLTPDAEVIRASGLHVHDSFTAQTIPAATRRLDQSGLFDDVQVLKRFASIDDPSQILIMIVVNEGPVKIVNGANGGAPAAIVRQSRWRSAFMYMPILDAEDGYGLRYGVRAAVANPIGKGSRVSVPLSWGGERRAGAELDKPFAFGRVQVGGALTSRVNPFYQVRDDRRSAWTRLEAATGVVRAGASAGIDRITFAGVRETVKTLAGDVALDTRLDPYLPRNAVYLFARVEDVFPEIHAGPAPLVRTTLDARGYLGVVGQVVLAARVVREDANQSESPYFKSLLGGMENLRGFEAGSFAGDTLVAGSLELRMPITSRLSFAKFGVRVFADAGTAYDKGQRYRDQTLHQGYGGGVFATAAILHFNLDVAHGKGAGTRVHVGLGVNF